MVRHMLGLAALVVALCATPAAAGDLYTPPEVTPTVQPDGTLSATGSNCPGSAEVDYVVTDSTGAVVERGTTTTNSVGGYTIQTEPLPGTNADYDFRVACGNEVLESVVGGNQAGPAVLSDTGSDSIVPLTRAGIALIAAGGIALYVARKRRRGDAGLEHAH